MKQLAEEILEELAEEILGDEGLTTWMYLDTADPPVVTCGVGHALRTVEAALELPWDQPGELVRADYAAVLAAPRGRRAGWYARLTKSRLPEACVRELLERDVAEHVAGVKKYFPGFDAFPRPARLAIGNMAFNLGAGFPRKYPAFTAAVLAGRWEQAAAECRRRGVSEERNARTAALLRQAAGDKQA